MLFAAVSLSLLAWLTLLWGILPHIDRWRPQVEAQASQALGLTVTIGHIAVRSAGWVPAFDLRDVRVRDRQGREALRLAQVTAALSPRSLLVAEPRFAQLLIEDLELEVRRDAQGRLHVAGIDIDGGGLAGDTAAADWVFEQQEWVLQRSRVRWTDELQGGPPLVLSDVTAVLRNGLRRHALRIDATPPAAWGSRFTLRGRFTQPLLARSANWRQWSGSAYAELPMVDVGGLGRLVALPFELQAGRGALRSWLDIERGRPTGATVDLALAEVALRLAPALQPLALRQVQGRLEAAHDADGVRLSASDFGFETDDGLVWPMGRLKLAWQQRAAPAATPAASAASPPAAAVTGGEFSADRLDLGLMARIAGRLPLGRTLHGLLDELAPQGVMNRLVGRWEGPPDAPLRYELRSQLTGLSMAAAAAAPPASGSAASLARPGLHNADLDFSATERGGEATLSMVDGELDFPGVFAEARLPMARLSAQLAWKLQAAAAPPGPAGSAAAARAPALQVQVRQARFANADAEGTLDGSWQTGPGEHLGPGGRWPGVLDLTGQVTRAQADRVARYLPLALPESVRHYVQDAVRGGQLSDTSFRVRGDLWDFPFAGSLATAARGEFRVATRLQGVQLAYVPSQPARGGQPTFNTPWPALGGVAGELVFERGAMRIQNASATLGGVELRGVQGQIPDLQAGVLQIEGQARGPLGEMLRFVNSSPVSGWLGDGLRDASGSGNAELRLGLSVPLAAPPQTSVRGALTLAGNALRVQAGAPLLEDTRGKLEFTEHGFSVAGASARLYGGELRFDGGSGADGALRFNGRGSLSADALRRVPELAGVAPLTGRLRGQAAYALQLNLLRGHPEITLTSTLAGLAIDLPPPLAKPLEASWPLRFQTALLPAQPGQPARDSLRLELTTSTGAGTANLIQARLQRNLAGAQPRIESGGIGVFDELPAPTSGLAANLKLGTLDVDAWRPLVAALDDAAGAGAGTGNGTDDLPLQQVNLRAERLLIQQRRLTGVTLAATHQAEAGGGTWRARLAADQAEGRIELRQPREGAGSVMARLSRLSVPPAEAAGIETLLEAAPTSVPALDITVDDLEWRGRKLGRAELSAINRPSPTRPLAREWQLSKLNLTTPDAQLRASGVWAPGSGGPGSTGRRMVLDFKLDIADSGALAERFGAGKAVRGGRGGLNGQVSWAGSPLAPDFPSLDGQFTLALAQGQLLNADPGATRLLGVFNLQALPRRLLFDFRDLYQEGFAFDSVTGDFKVARGVVATTNLRVRGVQAAVLMEGRFDLLHETQDLRVLVVPEIDAGTASLAYAVINPVVGLGAFVAQWLLQKPLEAANTREYRVTGPWADPKIETLARGEVAAPAASSPPRTPAPPG